MKKTYRTRGSGEPVPFELRNFPKFTTEAACQHNSSETTEQNFMKLDR
jgi:hypothetical protein